MSLIRTAVEVISVVSLTAYVLYQNRTLKSQIDIIKKTVEEHEEKISEKQVEKNDNTVCVDGVCSVIPPPHNFFQKHQPQLASGTFKLISK
jgi:hypothetical protein